MNAPGKAVTPAIALCLVMVVSALAGVTVSAISASALGSHAASRSGPDTGIAAVGPQPLGTTTPSSATPLASAAAAQHELPAPTCDVTVARENGGDNAVQSAINAASPGTVICIAAGTYPEQLNISTSDLTLYGLGGNGSAGTILEPHAPLAYNTFDYDGATPTSERTAALVLVDGSTGTPHSGVSGVAIENLQVNGSAGSSTFTGCGQGYDGIVFANSSGKLAQVSVTDVELSHNLFGCQAGLAIYAYDGYFNFPHAGPASVVVLNSTISNYDKNGITCDDVGVSCLIADSTVTGINGTTLIAQNGIQVAYGASETIVDDAVSGDHYTGSVPDNGDYFEPQYLAAGILLFDNGNTAVVRTNHLSGNDIGIYVAGTANATIAGNTITQGYSYGITLDLNTSTNYLGLPVYSSLPAYSTVTGNTVNNVNVGFLVYDNNVTIAGGGTTNVNVSVEALFDAPHYTYNLNIVAMSNHANVDGLLLGNVSVYQATPGMHPTDGVQIEVGLCDLTATGTYPSGDLFGIVANGSTVSLLSNDVIGFQTGIFVNPNAIGVIADNGVASLASLGVPSVGIWAGDQTPNPSTDTVGVFDISGNTVSGPGGGTNSPLAGGAGIIAGGADVAISDNTVSAYSASSANDQSQPNEGNDWWEGTQSVGILFGCGPSTPLADCTATGNTVSDNTIGIVVILTDTSFSTTWETGPVAITDNTFDENGGYGLFTSMSGAGPDVPQTSSIAGNVFNDTVTGAPGMDLHGQLYNVTGNVLIGTSASGDQGPSQGEGGPSIATASIEATDYWGGSDPTNVVLHQDLFVDTTLYWSTSYGLYAGASTFSGGELVGFSESGLPAHHGWSVTLGTTLVQVPAPQGVVGQIQNGSQAFAASSVGDVASPASGTLHAAGAPLTQVIDFTTAIYSVTFTETGLPAKKLAHAGWSVALGGVLDHATTSEIVISGAATQLGVLITPGPVGYRVSGVTGLSTTNPDTLVPTSGAQVAVTFAKGGEVALTFHEKGLGAVSWCVSLNGYQLCSTAATQKYTHLTPGTYSYDILPVAGETVSPTIARVAIPTSGTQVIERTTHVTLKYVATDVVRSGSPVGSGEQVAAALPLAQTRGTTARSAGRA